MHSTPELGFVMSESCAQFDNGQAHTRRVTWMFLQSHTAEEDDVGAIVTRSAIKFFPPRLKARLRSDKTSHSRVSRLLQLAQCWIALCRPTWCCGRWRQIAKLSDPGRLQVGRTVLRAAACVCMTLVEPPFQPHGNLKPTSSTTNLPPSLVISSRGDSQLTDVFQPLYFVITLSSIKEAAALCSKSDSVYSNNAR
jgi:hypothetical protein